MAVAYIFSFPANRPPLSALSFGLGLSVNPDLKWPDFTDLRCPVFTDVLLADPRKGRRKPERLRYFEEEVYSRRVNHKDRVESIRFMRS